MNIDINDLAEHVHAIELKLHTAYILQLLRESEFYVACPAYFFMREQGLACAEQFEQSCLSQGPNRSEHLNDPSPAVESFSRVTISMQHHAPQLLEPLGNYIRGRLGYHVDTIVLYYKCDGKKHSIQF